MKVYLSYAELSYFLFPEYRRIKEYGFISSNDLVLYELSDKDNVFLVDRVISNLFQNNIIITKTILHTLDLILDSRSDYIKFIETKKNIRHAKDIELKVTNLQDKEFIEFVKMSLILKRWYRESFSSHEKLYNLFKSLLSSSKEFILLYLEIRDYMAPQEIFSSILTFLLRLKNRDEQKESYSEFYRDLTRIATTQKMKPELTLLEFMALSKDIPLESRLLGFYLSLK